MSKPTRKQLCELFSQIADGKITGKMIQKLIENPSRAKIFKNILQARKTADGITDPYNRDRALRDIVKTSAKAEEFEQARKLAALIADRDYRADALAIIAHFSHKREDIEQAERERSKEKENSMSGTDLWC